jgi:sucrose-6F-phosphate phosphohydrolase
VQQTGLPQPDAIIGGVGTEIHLTETGANLDAWQRTFRDFSAAVVRAALESLPFLEPQPDALQSPYKVSYYAHNLAVPELEQIRSRLHRERIRAELVYSSGRDLDVIPAVANKGTAARFLARHWGMDHCQMIACGDSGNDLALLSPDACGVVVANAQPELRALRGDHVYHCSQSFAAGVLEGVRFWREARESS